MSTFTPGPWEAGNLDAGHFPCVFIGPHLQYTDNSGNGFRARITINEGPTPDDVSNGHGFGTTLETCRANARLIAAAPELLEALEFLLATSTALHRETDEVGWSSITQARAAIAKAKGE